MKKDRLSNSRLYPPTQMNFLWTTLGHLMTLAFVCMCFSVPFCKCQGSLSESICKSRENCSQCITAHPDCAWCSEEVDKTDDIDRWTSLRKMRCGRKKSMDAICNKSDIVYPESNLKKIIDHPLGTQEDIQMRPQRVRIQLRPGGSFAFSLEFKQAKDYPVDLYYLMDVTYTMRDDKDNLVKLGEDLIKAMKAVTTKFRIGFGSFVDKVALPFASTVPAKVLDPCNDNCHPPYGFINHLPLSSNTTLFTRKVKSTKISGNLDSPEGSFDAIMQVLVCQKEIGWRSKSRKLLLLATDGGFHFAGDGKLAGIVEPNDEKCHLNQNGEYTKTLELDYPTFAQVRRQIRQSKVNLIMAVTAEVFDLYNRLSNVFEGSSAGTLDRDSKNVVRLVRQQYDAITDFVELKDNSSRHFQISYFSACNDGKIEKRNRCLGLKVGAKVAFEIEIKAVACPANDTEYTEFIQIYPVGLNESTIIELSMICQCDCEKPEEEEKNSSKCSNGHGTFECGICNCNPNRYGKDCECSSANKKSSRDTTACLRGKDTEPCSGQGTCLCNQCVCDVRENPEEVIFGVFCETDNYNCNRTNGKVCGGNGKCAFRQCTCNPGWYGDTCQCTNATCYGKNQKEPCSGHGTCECGRCLCDKLEGEVYYGALCETKTDPQTTIDFCNDYNDCIVCKADKTGDDEKGCESLCTQKNMTSGPRPSGNLVCPYTGDKISCNYIFTYNPDIKDFDILEDCSKDNTLTIALGSVGGTLAVGLFILMVWKITTTVHDNREYAKFENEKKKAVWMGGNPIYKEVTSEFQNPTFNNRLSKTSDNK